MKGRVVIYSIVGCPFCVRTKGFLEDRGLKYIDINLDKNARARKSLVERTGKKTVPQIFFNEIHVGGWDDLSKLSTEEIERLTKLVNENEAPKGAPEIPNSLLAGQREENAPDNNDDEEVKDAPAESDFHCELDEYAKLVQELKESNVVGDHKRNFKTYKNSFIGREAVNWMVGYKNLERQSAIELCEKLISRHFGYNVGKESEFRDDESIYRFLEDDEGKALNSNVTSKCEPRPASELGEDLRQLILSIYNSHLSPDGKKVDYKRIGTDEQFKAYVQRTAELHRVRIEEATRKEKLAFFINIYNALVIHAYVTVGPPVNLWQRYKFFNTISYIIGGYSYSLNDMENGVLRANRKAIGAFRRPFKATDPRLSVALPEPEPKVHFALVCGAKSCPPIKTYLAEEVDDLLQLAAESFLEGEGCDVETRKREIRVSQILKWYKEDFGKNKEEIVQFVYNHMGDCAKRTKIGDLLKSKNFKLSYIPYDWSLNAK